MAKIYYTDGQNLKNIDLTLSQYSEDAWEYATGAPKGTDEELYSSVAAVFRACNMTAEAIASLPFAVMRGETEVDNSDEWKNVCGFMKSPRELIRLWRLSLMMTNQAYGFMEGNRVKKNLRYILPETIEPVVSEIDGLTGFKRRIGTTTREYQLTDNLIFYIWRLDHTTELLPAKATEFKALMAAAGVLYYVDYFTQSFFQRGGIKPTMLMVKGAPNTAEREKIEKVWDKVIKGAYKYLGKIFNAESISPVVIGEGVDNLKDQAIYQNKLSDIAMACGMPLSLLLANSANYATAQVEYKAWFDHEIIPWARYMEEVMNDQLFTPLGLHFEFRPEVSDPGQEDEVSRAGAYQAYVNAGMKPSIAAQVVGIELPPGIEYEDLDPEEMPEDEPEEVQPEMVEQSDTDTVEEDETEAKFVPSLDQFRELELWQTLAFRKFKRGELAGMSFEVKTLPEQIAGIIAEHLQNATTEAEVKRAFDFNQLPDVQVVEVKRGMNDESIKALADAINKAVEYQEPVTKELDMPVNNFNFDLGNIVKNVVDNLQGRIEVVIPEQPAPIVNITVPEQAAPVVNVAVEPPVNNVTVEQPDIKVVIPAAPKNAKVKRDGQGKITGIEMEN